MISMAEQKKAATKHILIVEDSEDDALMLSQVVQNILKHEAKVVTDGRAALVEALKQHYDLIMMDMRLPGLTGDRVVEALRRMDEYKDTPILMITAYDHAVVRKASLQAGSNIYLTKPVDIDVLVDVVSLYLSRFHG